MRVPFFASITRHAFKLGGTYDQEKTSVYAGEINTGDALRRKSELTANYGVALATSTERTRRSRTRSPE